MKNNFWKSLANNWKNVWHNFINKTEQWRQKMGLPKWLYWTLFGIVISIGIIFVAIILIPVSIFLTCLVRIFQLGDIIGKWTTKPEPKQLESKEINNENEKTNNIK